MTMPGLVDGELDPLVGRSGRYLAARAPPVAGGAGFAASAALLLIRFRIVVRVRVLRRRIRHGRLVELFVSIVLARWFLILF
jgi:hypothetical protein